MNKTYNFLNASPLWRAIKDNSEEKPMYLLFGIFGGIWGARLAKKRGGKTLDILQYSAGYFLFYAIIGVIVTVILDRTIF